ncbi:MAG: BlaI/MecI/CopY family transcriptional regulator [Planctomycetaceae bacterium]|jgi:predicted transcriptional regulator|nr:BlaI/MecI/CopY family transcriptional regulator [Planctomycetaceae bacterium]
MTELELNQLGVQQRRVMDIVWEYGSVTVQEVLEILNDGTTSPLAYTTVLATMQKLEKNGWLTHVCDEQYGRAYRYQAIHSRNKAIGDSLKSFAKTFLGGNKTLLFQHFVNDTELSEKELDEIRKIIAKRKKQ